MVDQEVDILIVGGGLVGAMLLHALAPTALRCLMVDNQQPSLRFEACFDARSLALSSATVRILKTLHLWSQIEQKASLIRQIHVSESGRFGNVLLESETSEPLGYVIENHDLNRVVYQQLNTNSWVAPATVVGFDSQKKQVTIKTPSGFKTIKTRFVVAADGANSCMRAFCQIKVDEKQYAHHALVANIGLARSHHGIAYERFTPTGPIAMLPMTDFRSALIWCLPSEESEHFLAMSDGDFLARLQHQFGYRLGKFIKVGNRTCYPLRQIVAKQTVVDDVVLIGNAAHTLHPVAGQGFNLGLRDVSMLAQYFTHHFDDPFVLDAYQKARQHDQTMIRAMTEGLIDLFTSPHIGVGLARSLGLVMIDHNPCLQRYLSRYARGYAGVVSDLICGVPLTAEASV